MQGDAGVAAWVRETKHAGSLDHRATVDEAIQWIDGLGNDAFFVNSTSRSDSATSPKTGLPS
jgi:hypothetical protein